MSEQRKASLPPEISSAGMPAITGRHKAANSVSLRGIAPNQNGQSLYGGDDSHHHHHPMRPQVGGSIFHGDGLNTPKNGREQDSFKLLSHSRSKQAIGGGGRGSVLKVKAPLNLHQITFDKSAGRKLATYGESVQNVSHFFGTGLNENIRPLVKSTL